MEDDYSSKDQESTQRAGATNTPARRPASAEGQGGSAEREGGPRVVTEFEVRERDVALRIRVERWPASLDASDDDTLVEAGYGHGV